MFVFVAASVLVSKCIKVKHQWLSHVALTRKCKGCERKLHQVVPLNCRIAAFGWWVSSQNAAKWSEQRRASFWCRVRSGCILTFFSGDNQDLGGLPPNCQSGLGRTRLTSLFWHLHVEHCVSRSCLQMKAHKKQTAIESGRTWRQRQKSCSGGLNELLTVPLVPLFMSSLDYF